MDKKLKAQWLKALRSGRYKQTTDQLKRVSAVPGEKPGYCCLGVLLTVSNAVKWHDDGTCNFGKTVLDTELNTDTRRLFGIHHAKEAKLINMNDAERKNFKEIADYIEKNL